MKKDVVFSIIVPVYKVEQYLDKCVRSLINQTYGKIEIILVDDGSPDRCPELCDKYAKIDQRICVIHKENGGLSDARNKGIEIASGEYILFVDSDDYIETDTCEKFVKYAKEGYDVLIGDAIIEGANIDLKHIEPLRKITSGQEYLKEAFLAGKAPMATWLNVYNRNFLLRNELFFKCGILHEDEQFTPRALLKADSVVCTGITFYHYMIREGSITTKVDKRKNMKDLYSTCMELEGWYKDIEDVTLKQQLLNSLCDKYLSLFQQGKMYIYGNAFVQKDFLKRNAFCKKTKLKVKLFCINPKLYYWINYLSKKISGFLGKVNKCTVLNID